MRDLMTKKEFKKKCEQEKTSSYKLILTASFITSLGLIIVLITLFAIKSFQVQVILSIIGGIFAVTGLIINIIGQIKISKEYQNYINFNE